MRRIQILIGVLVLVAVGGVGLFLYLTRGIAAPSQDIQQAAQQLAVTSENGSQTVFRISQADSKAEYNIGEVLNGSSNLVVGATNQVAGDILINLSQPSASQVGEIRIDARTLATDESRRDNTVARFVLQSESAANEYIVFQATGISGLPESVTVGTAIQFQVTGNLTIAGTTKAVTFDVMATLASNDQLTGHAETTIQLADFNLNIPQVPFVASVEDTVTLKLDFVANATTAS